MKYPGKKLCSVCGLRYHPDQYDMCFECYAKQPARIEQYKEPNTYESPKEYEEINL